jgi:hypothetical protein
MRELAQAVATRLKPPAADADPKVVMAWRWFVALTTGVTAVALSIHIMLACGVLAGVTGYPGFALASDVEEIRKETQIQRIRELSKEMLDAKQKQCVATGEVRRLYLDTYNGLRAEYFMLTKREFPDPDCRDF